MKTMHHSPVSPMDLSEEFFLRGYAVDEPQRCEVEHYAKRHETALVGFGWALVVCVNILLWCAAWQVVAAVWRAWR